MTKPDYFGDYWRARLNRAELEHQQELTRLTQQLNACQAQRDRAIRALDVAISRAERAEHGRDHSEMLRQAMETSRDSWVEKCENILTEMGVIDGE